MSVHVPVMLAEVMAYLNPQPGEIFIDASLGGGSYSLALAKAVSQSGQVLSIDWDQSAIIRFRKLIKQQGILNIKTRLGNFAELAIIAKEQGISLNTCAGIVFDLGLSSDQLEDRNRGFSFQREAPLNMAFSEDLANQTIEIINNYSLPNLVEIFKKYGQSLHAYRVARAIVSFRRKERIVRVKQLVKLIEETVPASFLRKKIHPATLFFQALRIATNDELVNLNQALIASIDLLKSQGKIAVVSFHSGEDRLVKNFFRNQSRACLCSPSDLVCNCLEPKLKILTKKPLIPKTAEVEKNPRARSAKLRLAEKK